MLKRFLIILALFAPVGSQGTGGSLVMSSTPTHSRIVSTTATDSATRSRGMSYTSTDSATRSHPLSATSTDSATRSRPLSATSTYSATRNRPLSATGTGTSTYSRSLTSTHTVTGSRSFSATARPTSTSSKTASASLGSSWTSTVTGTSTVTCTQTPSNLVIGGAPSSSSSSPNSNIAIIGTVGGIVVVGLFALGFVLNGIRYRGRKRTLSGPPLDTSGTPPLVPQHSADDDNYTVSHSNRSMRGLALPPPIIEKEKDYIPVVRNPFQARASPEARQVFIPMSINLNRNKSTVFTKMTIPPPPASDADAPPPYP